MSAGAASEEAGILRHHSVGDKDLLLGVLRADEGVGGAGIVKK